MSTNMIGTLVEIRDPLIVLTGPTHIMLQPGMRAEDLVVGERLMVTATRDGGRWVAESIERYPG